MEKSQAQLTESAVEGRCLLGGEETHEHTGGKALSANRGETREAKNSSTFSGTGVLSLLRDLFP